MSCISTKIALLHTAIISRFCDYIFMFRVCCVWDVLYQLVLAGHIPVETAALSRTSRLCSFCIRYFLLFLQHFSSIYIFMINLSSKRHSERIHESYCTDPKEEKFFYYSKKRQSNRCYVKPIFYYSKSVIFIVGDNRCHCCAHCSDGWERILKIKDEVMVTDLAQL